MSTPHLSVVVPVKNGAATIVKCVESLLALDYSEDRIERIFIDNGSEDDTVELLSRYPVKVLHEPRPGAAAARNAGLAAACGAVIGFTDADCVVEPDWARTLEAALDRANADAVMGFAYGLETTDFARIAQTSWESFWFDERGGTRHLRLRAIDTRNCAVRREVLEALGGFDPSYLDCADLELGYRVHRAGHAIEFVPEMRVGHHNPENYAVSLAKGKARLRAILRMMDELPDAIPAADLPFPRSAFHRAAERRWPGPTLDLAMVSLELSARLASALLHLGLVIAPRHWLTAKVYRVGKGMAYDAGILRHRRRRRDRSDQ